MCDSKGNWLKLFLPLDSLILSNMSYKKAKKKDEAAINAANQAAQKQVEQNKLANQTQSTEELSAANVTKKLASQKIPLNTASTGATIGNQTSVGLNLGGY